MAYLCLQRTPHIQIKYFMFDWWIYRLFVSNTTLKRNSVQMMIFVNVCSTWSMVNIKDAFWYVNNKKWPKMCKFVSPFSFYNTYGLPVLSMDTKCPKQVFEVSLVNLHTFVLNWAWKRFILQIMLFVFVCLVWGIVEINTRFETYIKISDINCVSLFNLYYLITIMVYLYSQRTPNVKINYFLIDWSMNRIFVLNRGWKHVSLQIMIFVYARHEA
jgi:hypothetical protein